MPGEIRAAVDEANADDDVHVIVLAGAGRAFCAGYDLKDFAEGGRQQSLAAGRCRGTRSRDYRAMKRNTDDFMSAVALAASRRSPRCTATRSPAAATSRCAATWSSWPRTRASATCRRASGAARPPRCGSTGSAPSGPSACCSPATPSTARRPRRGASCSSRCRREARRGGRAARRPHRRRADQPAGHAEADDQPGAATTWGCSGTQMLATLFDGITRHTPEGLLVPAPRAARRLQGGGAWRDSGKPIPEGRAVRGAGTGKRRPRKEPRR